MENLVKAVHDFFLSPYGQRALFFILGFFIALLVTRMRFARAGKNLARENERLRKLALALLRALARSGLASVRRDQEGKPVGLVFHLGARAGGKKSGAGPPRAVPDN